MDAKASHYQLPITKFYQDMHNDWKELTSNVKNTNSETQREEKTH